MCVCVCVCVYVCKRRVVGSIQHVRYTVDQVYKLCRKVCHSLCRKLCVICVICVQGDSGVGGPPGV